MDDAIAVLADTGTGTAIARSVEPAAGDAHAAAASGPASRCLNCGTFLIGSHCHHCGQTAQIHRSITAFGHDFLHSVLHFEGKAWRTLPLLAWRPGELTRRYIQGERAQFISPLALFLFTVFLTFAVFNMVGIASGSSGSQVRINPQEALIEFDRGIAETEARLAAARTAGTSTEELVRELAALRRSRATAAELARSGMAGAGADFAGGLLDAFSNDSPEIGAAAARIRENPALSLYKLQSNSYKYSWLLIPLSAPFLWLLFPFSRRFGWYDHLVFVTYSISFMALLWVVLRLLSLSGLSPELLLTFGVLYAPFHMYRQLRGAYRCSRLGALFRTVVLQIASFATILSFMLVLLSFELTG